MFNDRHFGDVTLMLSYFYTNKKGLCLNRAMIFSKPPVYLKNDVANTVGWDWLELLPEDVHVDESFDAAPELVSEELHGAGQVRHKREPQQEVQLLGRYLAAVE